MRSSNFYMVPEITAFSLERQILLFMAKATYIMETFGGHKILLVCSFVHTRVNECTSRIIYSCIILVLSYEIGVERSRAHIRRPIPKCCSAKEGPSSDSTGLNCEKL